MARRPIMKYWYAKVTCEYGYTHIGYMLTKKEAEDFVKDNGCQVKNATIKKEYFHTRLQILAELNQYLEL